MYDYNRYSAGVTTFFVIYFVAITPIKEAFSKGLYLRKQVGPGFIRLGDILFRHS